ncbi:hypothetical protein P153DRAFT_430791 [Dothidotthia symphoricarpi CBS 119687]|uniref:RING-type domain-containing protein n=1 Tax=Dothidotthia symphoricarpi CBS 119687 TaxID=1392245 RepID=A0A6A6AIA1_9PLEO|nr:uncharacterized protein P153DRAFT_430791 [Dothidotthia symphoricarpi CBS 119687]KAF2130624.1 hypothetical protein P153DRAFT_430791 [Dothidotthia symphoricarpi CBS 119687]
MDQAKKDHVLRRLTRFFQLHLSVRTLHFYHNDQVDDPSIPNYHLRRARLLLFRFLHFGLKLSAERFPHDHMLLRWVFTGYTTNGPFQECGPGEDERVADDTIMLSRDELLKGILYHSVSNTHDNGKPIHDTLKDLYVYFMDAMVSNEYLRTWHAGQKVACEWNSLSERHTLEFLTGFEIGKDAMARWGAEIDKRAVHDLTYWRSREFQDEPLKTECNLFDQEFFILENEASSFIQNLSFQEHCANKQDWCVPMQGYELPDEMCPMCSSTYDRVNTSALNPWDHTRPTPVQLRCKHIMCFRCFTDNTSEAAVGCPICSTALSPPTPQQMNEKELNEDISHIKPLFLNGTLPCSKYAKYLLPIVSAYLAKLPSALPAPDYSSEYFNFANWTDREMGFEAPLQTLNYVQGLVYGLDYRGWEELDHARCQLAVDCMRLARDRLEAFLNGDEQVYKIVCKRQLYVRARYEGVCLSFALASWIRKIHVM